MKIYLAARYSRREELCGYADALRGLGHVVDARWLLGNHQIHEGADKVEAWAISIPIEGRAFAVDDYEDVRAADMVISFSEEPRSGNSRGGRHVEFGLAVAWGKKVKVVGPRENVFHCLPTVEHHWMWADCLESLKEGLCE